MACLRRRLCSLPTDVENLYVHILKRIEPEYKEESLKIFQIFRANNNNLDIFTLQRALLCPDHHAVLQLKMHPLTAMAGEEYQEQVSRIYDMTVLRLGSRCKGLLELDEVLEDITPIVDSASPQGVLDGDQEFSGDTWGQINTEILRL